MKYTISMAVCEAKELLECIRTDWAKMILGVNTSHNSSFCLVNREGGVEWLLEEERFSRIKDASFGTLDAIEFAQNELNLNPDDVESIVYSFEMNPNSISEMDKKISENFLESFGESAHKRFYETGTQYEEFDLFEDTGSRVAFERARSKLESIFQNAEASSLPHHLCHAASVYYPFCEDTAAILIIDGAGRIETTTIWKGTDNELIELERVELPHSLGLLYWIISGGILGLTEGQTMGLASYGNPVYVDCLLNEIIEVAPNGLFRLRKPVAAWSTWDSSGALEILQQVIGVATRKRQEPILQIHADLASSIQEVTEMATARLAIHATNLAGSSTLCLAGGVAQNCSANGVISKLDEINKLYLQPAAHDAGTSMGAALEKWTRVSEKRSPWRQRDAFLGAKLNAQEPQIAGFCVATNNSYQLLDNPSEVAAKRINSGEAIAFATGRAEIGPRALGHRSLLAHPSLPFMTHRLNTIKKRESWRPIALACLSEKFDIFFDAKHRSPFMMLSHRAKVAGKKQLSSGIHIDGSARAQHVSPADSLYSEISSFNSISQIPALLNTSLNGRGEPIIQRSLEALVLAADRGINTVFLDNFLINLSSDLANFLIPQTKFLGLLEERLAGKKPVIVASPKTSAQERNLSSMLGLIGVEVRKCNHNIDIEYDEILIIFDVIMQYSVLQDLREYNPYANVLVQEKCGYVMRESSSNLLDVADKIISNIFHLFDRRIPILVSSSKNIIENKFGKERLEIILNEEVIEFELEEAFEFMSQNLKSHYLLVDKSVEADSIFCESQKHRLVQYKLDWIIVRF